jgi:hypothetical protein
VFGVCRERKAIVASTPARTMCSGSGSALFTGIVPAPIPGLHIGGAVLYKAQRSGVFRPSRVIASRRESVTISFPRCDTERTVAWSTMVVFDANQVDQPWKPPECHGAMEPTEIRPGPSSGAVLAVEPTAGPTAVVEAMEVVVVHTVGPTEVLDTTEGAPAIGSRIGEALIPDALYTYSPGTKRLPQVIKAQTTARVGAADWRRDGSFAAGDANWTRAQVAQGHHRTHDSRWCVRTAVDLQVEPDGDVFLQGNQIPYRTTSSFFRLRFFFGLNFCGQTLGTCLHHTISMVGDTDPGISRAWLG